MQARWAAAAFSLALLGNAGQSASDPDQLLREADRLGWLRAWTAAEPKFLEAQKLFAARGDGRDALYAEVSAFRGALPRMSVPAASARLAEYLDQPLVQSDDRLRLRVLVIKGETDEDLDPTLAAESWRAAQTVAERLGDAAWANRARGELGLVAFLQGDVAASIVGLGQATRVAQTNGDTSSLVRWTTLFGLGLTELNRPQEALDFYDRALKIAATVPELQFPVMTYVGRSNALVKLGRLDEADNILTAATAAADRAQARGYQAQLLVQRAEIASQENQPDRALALLDDAMRFAKAAGGNRIVAEIALDAARIQRQRGADQRAEQTLNDGIQVARAMEERLLLPRLLGAMADLRSAQRRFDDAATLLDEAGDILHGLFTTTSSPWVQSRLIAGMNDVFIARIRLEGARGPNAARMYTAIEEARGRPLLELLVNKPLSSQTRPAELQASERRISALQRRLLQTTDRSARQQLLDQIFEAEQQLAPATTALFTRSRRTGVQVMPRLNALQAVLQPDEVFVEFALADPTSYALVATHSSARMQSLPAAASIASDVDALLKSVQSGADGKAAAATLAASVLSSFPELQSYRRVLISPDGPLHNVPFELLAPRDEPALLESHVVAYVPSGSVLTILRGPRRAATAQRVLAVGASPTNSPEVVTTAKAIARDVYDLDPTQLKPLPSANDEARSVGTILGGPTATVLVDDAAREDALKRQALTDYGVLHFAVHGLPSTKFPSRAALLLRPGGNDDGVLEAREILLLHLNAALVTLSACDTGSGSVHGQDGPASLVRPFIASGARSVVANLWAADDAFSLALMREFYRRLAAGDDVAEALRTAKLQMIKSFGPQAVPRLWSGVLVYGDGRGVVAKPTATSSRER
jgi:CHAT domain-containing protein/tetratricopeptide (TPR) repeat protein